jgi:hypothetical protein
LDQHGVLQTLSDVEARALYDSIAGFSTSAINPFQDVSYPADQVRLVVVISYSRQVGKVAKFSLFYCWHSSFNSGIILPPTIESKVMVTRTGCSCPVL